MFFLHKRKEDTPR